MDVTAISDLHGHFPQNLLGGDLLIIAGDCTTDDSIPAWHKFFDWLDKQPYRKKVLIAGNHDNFCKQWAISGTFTDDEFDQMYPGEKPTHEYLCDSGIEIEGVKIWGTPWTPWFKGVHPKCKAFMASEKKIDSKFSLIPEGTDILITHGPMWGILDQNYEGKWCGSTSLRTHIERVMPKIHLFGHIHENGGMKMLLKHSGPNTICMNCSYVDENYKPTHKPFRIQI